MKKLLSILKDRAIFGATVFLTAAPVWAAGDKDGTENDYQKAADAFGGMADFLIAILQGKGGLVLVLLAFAGAVVGMVTGKTVLVWSMIGVIVLLAVGIGVVKSLFEFAF